MAQVVNYYDNHVTFTEGPFVACDLYEGGYRIEVEQKGHKCPIIPGRSIQELLRAAGLDPYSREEKLVKHMVDHLNL